MSAEKSFYDSHDYPLASSIGYLVRQLRLSLVRCVDAEMVHYGLTDAQWTPLLLIRHGRANTASALAQEMGIDAGAMTRTLGRLQGKGLIRRSRSRRDRRVWTLELTPAGEQAAAQVPSALARANNLHLAGFQQVEFEQLRGYLLRMIDNGRHGCGARLPGIEAGDLSRGGR